MTQKFWTPLAFVTALTLGASGALADETRAPDVKSQVLAPREIFKKTASAWSGDIFLLPRRNNTLVDPSVLDPAGWYPSTINGEKLPPHPINMHGVAWDYDLRIPLVFWDARQQWFKPGSYNQLAVQQDIVPTLAAILDVPVPARKGGRVLRESLAKANAKKPKVIVIFVQDQMGQQYLAAHPGKAPYYESLIRVGANYKNASVAHVDVETSVGHAAVGSGTWPGEHGVAGNQFQHPGISRSVPVFMTQNGDDKSTRQFNPMLYFTPALSDVWTAATQGKGQILAVAPAGRAAISMGGHGALFSGGVKTAVVWADFPGKANEWSTEQVNYLLPKAFAGQSIEKWIRDHAKSSQSPDPYVWMGHPLLKKDGRMDATLAMATPAAASQQGELTIQAINELGIGRDEITDLVWFNTKSTDYCGHLFGYESDECGEVLRAADREAKRITDHLAGVAGEDVIVALTADHGAAPLQEMSGGLRLSTSLLRQDLNTRFDRRQNHIDVVSGVTSSQIYVNRSELAANGFTMKDMVAFLKSYQASLSPATNARAEAWLAKGRAARQRFFEDVVSKD